MSRLPPLASIPSPRIRRPGPLDADGPLGRRLAGRYVVAPGEPLPDRLAELLEALELRVAAERTDL